MKRIVYPTARWASTNPDHPAVIAGDLVLSYREMESRVIGAAARLKRHGIVAGDRVAIIAANSPDWVILTHATARIAAILVPLGTRWTTDTISRALGLIEPAIVLVDAAHAPAVSAIPHVGARTMPLADLSASPEASSSYEIPGEIAPDLPHTIVFTSGTTGAPRGVCLNYRNHLAAAFTSALNLGSLPEDRWLANLPFHHVGGLAIALRAALYGTTVVVHERFDAELTLRSLADDRVTQMSLVGTTLARLLEAAGGDPFPESVRSVLVGGGPASAELLRRARRAGLPVLPTYGMTETASQATTLSPSAPEDKLHTAGLPLSLCEIAITDAAGKPVSCGIEGSISVRGPMVGLGYWTGPDRIEPFSQNGWLRTNDIGTWDEDGYLIVRGRADTVIISGGEKIFPEEIELALEQAPGVSRAAVLGLDDPEWGERLVALVESAPAGDFNSERLRDFLRRHLAPCKIPRVIAPVAQIPLTPLGKIDRSRVKELCVALTSVR